MISHDLDPLAGLMDSFPALLFSTAGRPKFYYIWYISSSYKFEHCSKKWGRGRCRGFPFLLASLLQSMWQHVKTTRQWKTSCRYCTDSSRHFYYCWNFWISFLTSGLSINNSTAESDNFYLQLYSLHTVAISLSHYYILRSWRDYLEIRFHLIWCYELEEFWKKQT
jgi:hypothetical protein